jgi:hypothetical protein
MGREEIGRLRANVWVSPAVLREGVPGAGWIYGVRPGRFLPRSIRPGCTSRAAAPFPLGAETSRAGRLEGVRVFSGTAGTCRVRVRNPGALRGRLGAGVVAYVPLIRALVTLSRAPRETALFPVHCSRCIVPTASLPGGIRRPHILRSVEEPRVICRVFSRGPGRRIPDRLTMSRYVAPPARVIPGCAGHFFQSIGLHPGRVGA